MRNIIAVAIFLAVMTAVPALCQEAVPAVAVVPVPEVAAITTIPVVEVPQANWTEAVPPPAPVVEAPAPIAEASNAASTIPEPETTQSWIPEENRNTPVINYVNTESNELIEKINERRIFIYTPRDANGMALVPEPSSFVAIAVGLTGMVATVSRRRKKVQL